MSGLYGTGSGVGLYLPPAEDPTEGEARGYIQAKWQEFLNLWIRIIDLQHRATLAKQAAEAVGDVERAEAAEMVFDDLAYLGRWHNEIVYRIEALQETTGLGAIEPITLSSGVIAVTVLALLVAWSFRRYAAQERALEAIEAGTITAEQLIEMTGEDPPVELMAGLTGLLKWGAIAFVGMMIFRGIEPFLPNPPLTVLHANPPGTMSGRAWSLAYRHADDGEDYIHEFGPGVNVEALEDGSVHLFHSSRPIWREF